MDILGEDAAVWLTNYLRDSNAATIAELANDLLVKLRAQVVPPKQIIHLAGFEAAAGDFAPIIGHISSVDLTHNGYQLKPNGFHLQWDFRAPQFDRAYYQQNCVAIFNGFGDGRDAFAELHCQMMQFRRNVWGNSNWQFTRPELSAEAQALRLELKQISLFFEHSSYPVPFIGGAIQVDSHAWPRL